MTTKIESPEAGTVVTYTASSLKRMFEFVFSGSTLIFEGTTLEEIKHIAVNVPDYVQLEKDYPNWTFGRVIDTGNLTDRSNHLIIVELTNKQLLSLSFNEDGGFVIKPTVKLGHSYL